MEPTRSIAVIQVKIFQIELIAEIYFNSPVRANGKVILIKFN